MRNFLGLLLFAVVLLSSCEQENVYSDQGKPIRFYATTSSVNTKTSYQGYTVNGKEAIIWEDGDANGFMAATADGKSDDTTVNLTLKPMFTTLEFTVSPGYDSDVVVNEFRLAVRDGSRVVLAGDFKATLSSQADPSIEIQYPNTSGEIKVSLGTGGITVKKGESLTFSVLALPIDLTDLVAYFTLDGVERKFPLVDEDGKFIKIEAGQKARITALGLLNPSKYKTAFSVSIDGQDIDDFNLSAPGANGTIGLLPGVFTIGDRKVRFSKGNLQAVLENGVITRWQFAEHQWDVVGNSGEDLENETGVVDLFQSSTTAPLNRWGTFSLNLYSVPGYDGAYLTWPDEAIATFNQYIIGTIIPQYTNNDFVSEYGSGWCQLGDDFDDVLMTFVNREYGPHSFTDCYDARCTPATIEGVYGLVVFPDSYSQPEGVPLQRIDQITYMSGGSGVHGIPTNMMNTYTSDQWFLMEAAGAVFLPGGWYDIDESGEITNEMISYHNFGSGSHYLIQEGLYTRTINLGMPDMIRLVQYVE